jgi:hypothetical protein
MPLPLPSWADILDSRPSFYLAPQCDDPRASELTSGQPCLKDEQCLKASSITELWPTAPWLFGRGLETSEHLCCGFAMILVLSIRVSV